MNRSDDEVPRSRDATSPTVGGEEEEEGGKRRGRFNGNHKHSPLLTPSSNSCVKDTTSSSMIGVAAAEGRHALVSGQNIGAVAVLLRLPLQYASATTATKTPRASGSVSSAPAVTSTEDDSIGIDSLLSPVGAAVPVVVSVAAAAEKLAQMRLNWYDRAAESIHHQNTSSLHKYSPGYIYPNSGSGRKEQGRQKRLAYQSHRSSGTGKVAARTPLLSPAGLPLPPMLSNSRDDGCSCLTQ